MAADLKVTLIPREAGEKVVEYTNSVVFLNTESYGELFEKTTADNCMFVWPANATAVKVEYT